MSDMLVKLYDNPKLEPSPLPAGVKIVRAMALDSQLIKTFVSQHFDDLCSGCVDEVNLCLVRQPASVFIAIKQKQIIGFCCYDASAKGMLGPLGVAETYRGLGLASELMKQSLLAMKQEGYAYAVIGWVSSVHFYRKIVDAIEIEDSSPGVYQRLVQQ